MKGISLITGFLIGVRCSGFIG